MPSKKRKVFLELIFFCWKKKIKCQVDQNTFLDNTIPPPNPPPPPKFPHPFKVLILTDTDFTIERAMDRPQVQGPHLYSTRATVPMGNVCYCYTQNTAKDY